jgi:hypothetical protein
MKALRKIPMRAALLAMSLSGLTACDDSEPPRPAWILDVEAETPLWLSQTGLFSNMEGLKPAQGVLLYSPPHPLWSSGTAKQRLLYLPPGETPTPGDVWQFPVGTVLAKTFSYEDIEGRTGNVALETRLMIRRADGWHYADYHWNVEGTEARRFEPNWGEQRLSLQYAELAFEYTIPGELDCKGCHEAREGAPVLGMSNLNLDPALARRWGVEADVLPARSSAEEEAMSYLVGNCVHCHHGGEGNDNASYSLKPADLVANVVNQPTESSASGDGIRVLPGNAEDSALFEAVVRARAPEYGGDFKPMPPLGIDQQDPAAAQVLRAWIEGLSE